jgi:hypothetical protein
MKLSRNISLKIHYILDQLLPPVIRDSKLFMSIPMKLLYKDKASIFMGFKPGAYRMTREEYRRAYREVQPVLFSRETDLNSRCVAAILENITGDTVLDAGGGNCYLAGLIDKNIKVAVADIAIERESGPARNNLSCANALVEELPFRDKAFDTVICAHTLEHVQDIFTAVKELRRVTRERLIIVVPRQRPYRYTFDLHLHFFPYRHSLLTLLGGGASQRCEIVGKDIFYVEDMR